MRPTRTAVGGAMMLFGSLYVRRSIFEPSYFVGRGVISQQTLYVLLLQAYQ